MQRIWIPQPMYRLFPWASVAAGVIFCVCVQKPGAIGLCGVLVGYGVGVMMRRMVGRW